MRRLERSRPGLTETNWARLRQLDDSTKYAGAAPGSPQKLMGAAARNPDLTAARSKPRWPSQSRYSDGADAHRQSRKARSRSEPRPPRTQWIHHIVVEPEEVKNSEPLDYPMPPQSVELIERYLRRVPPPADACRVALPFSPEDGAVQRWSEVSPNRSPTRSTAYRYADERPPVSPRRGQTLSRREARRIRGRATRSRATLDQYDDAAFTPAWRRHRRFAISTRRSSSCGRQQTPDDQAFFITIRPGGARSWRTGLRRTSDSGGRLDPAAICSKMAVLAPAVPTL